MTERRALIGLAGLSALLVVAHLWAPHATAWHWFHDAGRLLVGDDAVHGAGGLSLYRDHPEFQFGPLAVVAVVPFTVLGLASGSWAAIVVGSILGLGVVVVLVDAVRRLRPDVVGPLRDRSLLVGAVLLVLTWSDVAVRTAHFDDALALAATAGAVWALATGRPWGAALLLGVAAAIKPWAVPFCALALAAPGPRRWLRLALPAAVVGVTWLPFVLAESATLDTRRYEIFNEASSALRALGVTASVTPDWVRPAQLLGGLAVALVLVLFGRWPAALMAAVAVRLVLDPAANRYYTVGLVVAVLVFEWVERPERIPGLAVGSAVLLEGSQLGFVPGAVGGWMRVAVVAAVLVTAASFRPHRPDPLDPEASPALVMG